MHTLEQLVIHLYSNFFPLKKGAKAAFLGIKIQQYKIEATKKKKRCSGLKWDLKVLYLTQSPD